MELTEEEFNKQMIDAGIDWDYQRESEASKKIGRREKKFNKAISMLKELIDEESLVGLYIKYRKKDGFYCRKLFNVANILEKPF